MPDASSEFLGSEKRFSIDADHRAMCRFSNIDDDGYRKISQELRHLSQRAQELYKKKVLAERNSERENITKCQYQQTFPAFSKGNRHLE